MEKIITIALDSPSGSGKSTIAKTLSKELNILYLDTGAMYRATAVKALKLGIDTFDANGVDTFINDIDLEIKYIDGAQRTYLDGEDVSERIREPEVSMAASNISSLKNVRLKMVDMQRKIAKGTSCILDGRDIGSYVLPDAEFKFYITASVEVRTDRRFKELKLKGHEVDYNALKAEIEQRDYNDRNRDFAPLRKADDAIEIDTSDMTIEQVIETISSEIEKK
jgi:cytidylate kinase